MDHSQHGANGGTDHEPTGRPNLHKKRSLVRMRPSSTDKQPRPITTTATHADHAVSRDADSASNGKFIGTGQRKGSIRNVVRKIFGRNRSSRLVTPAQQHTTLPRHAYHRSEPHGLPTTQEAAGDDREEAHYTPQRALSTPLQIHIPAISSPKVRSPYAVEFPKSALLKPLEMSSPFDAPVASLPRRKTLPSISVAGADATAIASTMKKSSEHPPIPARSSAETSRQTPDSEIGIAISGVKERRRSRSAGGMRTRDSGFTSEPERNRSEEIQFWRESHHGSVLRASGFTVPLSVHPPEEPQQDDKWQKTTDGEPSTMADSPQGVRIASHSRQGTLGTLDGSTQLNFRSTSGLSRDLEDRVAQLESNLQFFQRSLNKLQADRNRRTVIVGDYPPVDQSKHHRTPSMLADDLHFPDNHTDTNASEPPNPFWPVTATAPPRSPIAECPPVPPLPGQTDYTTSFDSHLRSSNLLSASPTVTFKSLYQMLSDERSARCRLETQLHSLRSDIQDLQHQVSTNSNTYSHRNSYMLSHEATMASARLRNLLRETGSDGGSPEETPRKSQVYVSRFSASTTGGVQEDVQTPYEEWKTPREEQDSSRFEKDGEMF
jgi:hypothetical protein